MIATTFWDTFKSDLKGAFQADIFQTWFEPLQLLQDDNDMLLIGVPTDFASLWIQENYLDILSQRLEALRGRATRLQFQTLDAATDRQQSPTTKQRDPKAIPVLNPKNTFDNFVVGAGNQMAHAACLAVANAPAKAYNPLFLYGDTGLGKTHMMHAIAHHALKHAPHLKIVYISTEKFTNEFIMALQENSLSKFRKRYRQTDILLIDDIHFLSGKERIQEEFFHTFNDLFESQKQIVLCSDRPASEIAKLESRLVSRFQWGLVCDIQPPDFETRVAILSKKATAMHLQLPSDVVHFLAERVTRNVRRLEGALNRIASHVQLMQGRVDASVIEKLLNDIVHEEPLKQITIDMIQQRVSTLYQISIADLISKKRPANIALPRQVAMYLSRILTSLSLQDIGSAFGGRDHGTVIHACKTIENVMEHDATLKRNVDFLQNQLKHGR